MTKYKLALIVLICAFQAKAQNESDILLYSRQYNLGTARSQGLGGAFGALGADYSATYINPAGLGLYRRNEFHISAGITNNRASSEYLGNTTVDNRTGFNIPSFGLVFTKVNQGIKGDATKGIVSYSFSFGHNRTNDYQQNVLMQGYNTRSNITQFYIEHSNGLTPAQIIADPGSFANIGYQIYLTDTAGNNRSYYSPWVTGDNDYRLLQTQKITRRGAQNEYNFNAAMNIGDYVYLGAGLVLNYVDHRTTIEFTESDPDHTVIPDATMGHTYNSSYLRTNINTQGNGVAGRFGIIVRPVDVLRLGFSAQTRMRISMEEYYSYNAKSDINYPNFGILSYNTEEFLIKYDVITPPRYTASGALTLPSLGLLSADLDIVDYSNAKLDATGYLFTDANNAAKNLYQTAYNLRVGAEVKVADYYRLRAGYSLNTSPYKTSIAGVSNKDLTRNGYSLGFGYTDGQYFIDLAGVLTRFTEFSTPYVLESGYSPTGVIKNNMLNFVVTSGYRF
jgi:hypothetical protein